MRAVDPEGIGPEPVGDAPSQEAETDAQAATAEAEPAAAAAEPTPPSAEERAAAAEQEAKQKHDQLLRVAADFDNYRKRARRDVDDAARRAREDTLQAVLVVADNLERALDHVDEANSASIVDGVRLVHRQLLAVLERFEVRPFDSLGAAFNPEEHDAVGQLESAGAAPGAVVGVMQRGYRMGARVLRPAMVVVAKPPAPAPPPCETEPTAPPEGGTEEN